MPKVSICIPAYQQVHYLEKALTSVLRQSFDDYEIIVTDDSPDDSVEVLLGRFDFGGRLSYVRNMPALGSPRNWNRGIALARGDYVKILHHDDWFASSDALREYVDLMDSAPDVDFAFSGSQLIDDHTGSARRHFCNPTDFQAILDVPERLFCGNKIGAPSATIFRRSVFGEGFDPALKWLVDVNFYIDCIKRARNIAMTSECLITTPVNAAHQVTESCKSNALVELFEYQYLFTKYGAFLKADRASRQFMRHIFERYRVRRQSDLDRLGVARQLDDATFKSLHIQNFIVAKIRNRMMAVIHLVICDWLDFPYRIRGRGTRIIKIKA